MTLKRSRFVPQPSLSALTFTVGCLAIAAIAAALLLVFKLGELQWIWMAALAIFVAPVGTLRIPGIRAGITLSDAVTFACAALFGPGPAIIAAAASAVAASLILTTNFQKFLYNTWTSTVSMAGAAFATLTLFPDFGSGSAVIQTRELVGAAAILTLIYFLISSSLIAAFIALSNRDSFRSVVRESMAWTSLSNVAAGASAVVVSLLAERVGYYVLLVPIALLLMGYLFYSTYFRKLDSANQAASDIGEQLRQAQKMEAIGRLAGGVAHDFNNLLTAILGHCDLMLPGLGTNHSLVQHLSEIKKAGERATSLTRQLLAFSGRQMLQPTVLNLGLVVDDLQRMLGRLIGEDIELVTRSDPKLGLVRADRGQVEQVIMNLAVNSRDAMPGGGKLVIQTTNSSASEQTGNIAPGQYVVLAVSDTGCGMDEQTLSHIFEPFFTTKPTGKGTGLGLAMVYGIVRQSGAEIQVESTPGLGTTFKIFLPQLEEAEVNNSGGGDRATAPTHETVLLVEDEDIVRNLFREVLRMNGYNVLEASSGSDALRISDTHSGPIDLMVTDVVMPQMSGRELAKRLTEARPYTRVLFVSGYTEDAIVHHGVSIAELNFLQKPFAPDSLARKVREVLNADASTVLRARYATGALNDPNH